MQAWPNALRAVPGVELLNKTFFNEMTIRLPVPAAPIVELLARPTSLPACRSAGSSPTIPTVANLIVLAATELTTDADIDMLGECLHAALNGDGA